MDVVFLRKADAKRSFEGIDIGEKVLDQGGAASATKEQDRLGVLVSERFALRKLSFRARIFRLSVK